MSMRIGARSAPEEKKARAKAALACWQELMATKKEMYSIREELYRKDYILELNKVFVIQF